jgi:hypothetical protein
MLGNIRNATRRNFRFGLRSLLLLFAAIGSWLVYAKHRETYVALDKEVAVMKRLLGEVSVTDDTQFAIAAEPAIWNDERVWNVYLPEGTFRICLAFQAVNDTSFPVHEHRARINSGHHRIVVRRDQKGTVSVLIDGDEVMTDVGEPKTIAAPQERNWFRPVQSNRTMQHSTETNLELVREVSVGTSGTAEGSPAGLLIWIEKT